MSVWPCTKCGINTHIDTYAKNDSMCNRCVNQSLHVPQEIYMEEDSHRFASLESSKISSQKEDVINKPKHYNFATIEPIDVIEDWQLDFRLANALKYISRAGKKDPSKTKEDLQKAVWYINRYIIKECSDDK
jgi:hypothetical protein